MLAQRAVEKQRAIGNEATFHAVLLPYGTQADRADALEACEVIAPDVVHDIDIAPSVDAFTHTYETALGMPLADLDKGNVKARMRMIAHYALAGSEHLLVVGTDHAAEAVTGFYTKYGDGGADILPLAGLSKRQGKALLRQLDVPEHFVTKAPTADLLDTKPGQTDEHELGISYDELDDYLEGGAVAAAVAETIETRYQLSRHKREMPAAFTPPTVRSTLSI
jgi:NAD+ synthase